MTRHRRRIAIFFLLLAVLSIVPAPSATAQDLDAIAGRLNLADIDGIQVAVSRSYGVDIETLIASTSGDVPTRNGPLLMVALVAEFDSRDRAEDAAGEIQERFFDQLPDDATGFTMASSEVVGIGNRAWTLTGTRTFAGGMLAMDGMIVQQGRSVSLVVAVGTGLATDVVVRNVMAFILVARPGTGHVIYDVSGTSRGGLWDRLPKDPYDTHPIYDNQVVLPTPPDSGG